MNPILTRYSPVGFSLYQTRRVLIGVALILGGSLNPSAYGHSELFSSGCLAEGPLLSVHFRWPADLSPPARLGPIRIPVRPGDQQPLSHATLTLISRGTHPNGSVLWSILFEFDDPLPVGLPFSFEAIRVTTPGWFGPHTALIDWSQACTGPGRSLFPGGRWDETFETPPLPPSSPQNELLLHVWGARN